MTHTNEANVADLIRVRMAEGDYDEFSSHLVREDADEYAGYLIAGTHQYTEPTGDGTRDVLEYVIQEIICLDPDEYEGNGSGHVTLSHETHRQALFASDVDDRYLDERAVIVAHSHPFSPQPQYSRLDNKSEPMAFTALTAEGKGPQASLIFGSGDSLTGRVWPDDVSKIRDDGVDSTDPIDEFVIVGEHSLWRIPTTDSRLEDLDVNGAGVEDGMRDRQALVHGPEGNAALRRAHVAVVGAGGLGSLLVQTLAHLGVGELTVLDPDVVEESNRSRIVGSRPDDAGPADATPDGQNVVPAAWVEAIPQAGRPKVEVMQRLVENIDPSITFHGYFHPVETDAGMEAALRADLIVSATDTAKSRAALSQAAKQYHRPLFDAGTNIKVADGTAKYIAGRLSTVTPERPCLDCQGQINIDRVIAEGKDPDTAEYGMDLLAGEQPAVISVNQQVAARTGFTVHRYLTGLLANRTDLDTGIQEYISGMGRPTEQGSRPDCRMCGGTSWEGIGDRGPSPGSPSPMEPPSDLNDHDRVLESECESPVADERSELGDQEEKTQTDDEETDIVIKTFRWLRGFGGL